jgi:DNA polymerase I-like protein with 3'-5' exonuclease and polymerase domains
LFPDDGARLACVSLAWMDGETLRSVGLPFDQGRVAEKLGSDQEALWGEEDVNLSVDVWKRLLVLLSKKQLVMHNAKFDLTMLDVGTRHWFGADLSEGLMWDTMLAAKALEPTASASLDASARRAGLEGKEGLDVVQGWLKKRKLPKYRYDLVEWSAIEPYVTTDAELTLQLYYWQREQIAGDSVRYVISRELDLCRVLFKMERRGIGFDSQRALEAAAELEKLADETEAQMPFKCDITAAKKYFFDEAGLDPERVTAHGAASLDDETIRKWAQEGVEWAPEYRRVKRARKAVSMWYRGYPEKVGLDGRLRTSYRQHTVVSGRLSVERVNLQAMPKADKLEDGMVGVRDLLVAKEGYGLWSLDMQQAELRAAAKYAGCTEMERMLALGADIHGLNTVEIMGVQPDAPDFKLKRDIGKKLTFSSLFHISGRGFQALLSREADIRIPLLDADALVQRWRNRYPEFSWAYYRAERRAKSSGWVRILPGSEYETRSYFGDDDWEHTAWNRMVQGSLAAWLRLWLVQVEEECPDALVLTVHDSIMLELPEETGDEVAAEVGKRAAERASEIFQCSMPVEVERYV